LYFSPNTTGMIMSRRMRLAGLEPCMGRARNAQRVLVGKPKE
jgi:hypothetical protein